jgi:hypothetical protein
MPLIELPLPKSKVTAPHGIARLAVLVIGAALSFPAVAADPSPGRLPPLAHTAPILADGLYTANDQLLVYIDHGHGQVRLKFADADEVFYLTNEPGALGSRILKYDTGELALQVAGWGGVTLYTPELKSGVPLELADVTDDLTPEPLSAEALKKLALMCAQDLAAHNDLTIAFAADWDALSQSESARGLAADAMRNAAAALSHAAKGPKRSAIAEHLHLVRVINAAKFGASVQNGTLVIEFVPQDGEGARPSSLLIAQALDAAF